MLQHFQKRKVLLMVCLSLVDSNYSFSKWFFKNEEEKNVSFTRLKDPWHPKSQNVCKLNVSMCLQQLEEICVRVRVSPYFFHWNLLTNWSTDSQELSANFFIGVFFFPPEMEGLVFNRVVIDLLSPFYFGYPGVALYCKSHCKSKY